MKTSQVSVWLTCLMTAMAQQQPASPVPSGTPNTNNNAAVNGIPNIKANLPRLDQKTVQSANQQMQAAGITDVCSQSLSRVATDWKTASDSIDSLVRASANQPVLPAAQAAQKAMQTEAQILNSRAGTKIDQNGIQAYESAGVAIGQAMGAVSQIRQIQGQPQAISSAADKATLDLQNLRTAQFATFGACGASVGATIDATDAQKPAGIPGSQMKVICQVPTQAAR